jgi:hypothetical protein
MLVATRNIVAWNSMPSVRSKRVASVDEQPEMSSSEPRYKSERKEKMFINQSASGISIFQRCTLTVQRCTLMVLQSYVKFEPESVPLVPTIHGIPVEATA